MDDAFARVKDILATARHLDGAKRAAFLDDACAGNGALRAEVDSLLDAAERPGGLPEQGSDVISPEALLAASDDGDPTATDAPAPPSRIGRYRILRRIAVGGMGAVYEAEQDSPHRRVALKMLRQDGLSDGLSKRFEREAEILGRLHHPGIAQIHEAGTVETADGVQPFFAMEFVEGRTITEHADAADLTVDQRLTLFASVCDAVEHAHEQGVVHRDLKPDNILVTADGLPKVLDFGVARATDADIRAVTLVTEVGQVMGTLPYMSPEQVTGHAREVDRRSDVYALGVVLFELLTGQRPHALRNRSMAEAARIIQEEDATRIGSVDTSFRGDIDTIVGKALEKDAGRRYETAAALATDIRNHLTHQPILAHSPSTFYQLRKLARRHRGLVAGLLVAFLALVTGLVIAVQFGLREAASADAARLAAYRANIVAASASLVLMNPKEANRLLNETSEDLRGFEWSLLMADADRRVGRVTGSWRHPVNAGIACRADGTLVGAVVREGWIVIVDALTGEELQRFEAPDERLAFTMSQDGSILTGLAPDGSRIDVWDVEASRVLPSESLEVGESVRWGLSADGSVLGILENNGTLTIRNTRAGDAWKAHDPVWAASRGLSISPSGSKVVRVGSGVIVADVSTGRLRETARWIGKSDDALPIQTVAFSPDESRMAISTGGSEVLIMRTATAEIERMLLGNRGIPWGRLFSADGSLLLANSHAEEFRIWDVETGDVQVCLDGPTGRLIALQSDGSLLASTDGDNAISTWSITAHTPRRLTGHSRFVYHVAFSPDGSTLASMGWDGRVRLWDTLDGRALAELDVSHETAGTFRPFGVAFTPDGDRLLAITNGGLITFDAATHERVATASDQSWLERQATYAQRARPGSTASDWSHLSGVRHVTSRDGSLRVDNWEATNEVVVLDRATTAELRRFAPVTETISALALSPDTTRLGVGSVDGRLRMFDFETEEETASAVAHEGEVLSIAFHPDGNRLATGGRDGLLKIWRVEPLEVLLERPLHDSYIHELVFSDDGTQLAAASGDHTVSLWTAVPASAWHARAVEAGR